MKELVDSYLVQYVPEFPKQVQVKLPTMQKIELPKKIEIKNG
jgi:hypothetical protein